MVRYAIVSRNDTATLKRYFSDNSIIFVGIGDSLNSGTLQQLVQTYKAVLVILIDSEPRYGVQPLAFYPWFYTANNINNNTGNYDVVDQCFSQYFKNILPNYDDLSIPQSYKTKGVNCITSGDSCYGYLRIGNGVVLELPFDGVWLSDLILTRFILAITHCLLNTDIPDMIIWATRTWSDYPNVHSCYPVKSCISYAVDKLNSIPRVSVSTNCITVADVELCYKNDGDVLDSTTIRNIWTALWRLNDKYLDWHWGLYVST